MIHKGSSSHIIRGILLILIELLLVIGIGWYTFYAKMSEKENEQIALFKTISGPVERTDEAFKSVDHDHSSIRQNDMQLYNNTTQQQPEKESYSKNTGNMAKASDEESTNQKDADCIIRIPSIDMEKIVYTGAKRDEHLENYDLITASKDMKYANGGNYIICGHASRLYGHSLNRLKEVQKGDLIEIETHNETTAYRITQIEFKDRYKTKDYYTQTDQRQLTIVSCARYVTDNSYILIQAIPE